MRVVVANLQNVAAGGAGVNGKSLGGRNNQLIANAREIRLSILSNSTPSSALCRQDRHD